LYDTQNFSLYPPALRGWHFTAEPFEDIELRHSDFIYADPPYDVGFTGYSEEGFKWSDQVRLIEWLVKHRGPVVLSNHATPAILSLYKDFGFRLTPLPGPRRISCNGNRTPANEVLAVRNLHPIPLSELIR
jgi:DNA adenine methylase